MDFIEPKYLFLLLPITIIFHTILKKKYRNLAALGASVAFYAAGSINFFPIIFISIFVNYCLGRIINKFANGEKKGNPGIFVLLGILLNAGLLITTKLMVQFQMGPLSDLFLNLFDNLAVPLGLSYITFQNISYLVDISNQRIQAEKNYIDFALYILLFPKLLVGPIVLYRDVKDQIKDRDIDIDQIAAGIRRFSIGMAKKILIADILGQAINPSLELSSPEYSSKMAWLILAAYTIQIFFDFSGYTDMALGLAKMMGFSFMDNFNYPYIAESITDFWRRWHISLSSWMREYVFIPLEFKRRKVRCLRQPTNLMVTFLITGLWHGFTLNFLLWGGLHGFVLGLETSFLLKRLKKAWKPIQHIYTMAIVMLGWIFFRANSLKYAFSFIGRLLGLGSAVRILPYQLTAPLPLIDRSVWLALALGILFSTPLIPKLRNLLAAKLQSAPIKLLGRIILDVFTILLFVLSIGFVTSQGYNRSIYGQF